MDGWRRNDHLTGNNLKISMLKLFNGIKSQNQFPGFMMKADIFTIYKGKGDLTNDEAFLLFLYLEVC